MKIIRYSSTAFTPQKQTLHIRMFEIWQNLNPKDYPEMEYTMQQLKQQHTLFYNQHKEDLQEGLWFFIDGYKDNQSLNHLKHKVPCYEAKIPDNIMVYDCNLEKAIPLTDPLVYWAGCYIPKRLCNQITNIKRRRFK
jgi:hypothetical protein